MKKIVTFSLLFTLSLTMAPTTQATISETVSKQLTRARKGLNKQWEKIKPCITKGKCSKAQFATFVAAAIALAIVLKIAIGKRTPAPFLPLLPSTDLADVYRPDEYDNPPIASEESLETLFTNVGKLPIQDMKTLVVATLSLATKHNSDQVIEKYKRRFDEEDRATLTDVEPGMELAKTLFDMAKTLNPAIIRGEFFNQLALVPSSKQREVNKILDAYNVTPIE